MYNFFSINIDNKKNIFRKVGKDELIKKTLL